MAVAAPIRVEVAVVVVVVGVSTYVRTYVRTKKKKMLLVRCFGHCKKTKQAELDAPVVRRR